MRWPLPLVVLAPLLVQCGPLIGLDENYYVVGHAGAGGAANAGSAGDGGALGGAGDSAGGTAMLPPAGASGEGGSEGGSAGGGGVPAIEIPDGKLVFHRYTTYLHGDSEMFVVTFPDESESAEIGETYGLCHPVNGIFSPDGTRLLVTATPRTSEPCTTGENSLNRSLLEVWILDLENPGAKLQVTDNGVADEDPQYAPDGSFVLFKHDGHLAKWDVGSATFVDCANLPEGAFCFSRTGVQQSKPVLTPDDKVCYHEWFGENADVFCFDLEQGLAGEDLTDIREAAAVHLSISDARPTVGGDNLYYVRWHASNNRVDKIRRKPLSALNGQDEVPAFDNDSGIHFSDPFVVYDDVVVFASDSAGAGKRDLFIAHFASETMYSLDDWVDGINSTKDDVGPAFWRAP